MSYESSYKNYYIRPPGVDELDKIKDFLAHHFYFDEPIGQHLCKIGKLKSVQTTDWSTTEKLKKNLDICLIAIEFNSREIAGALLNYRWTKKEADEEMAEIRKEEERKNMSEYVDNGIRYKRLASKPALIYYRIQNALFKPMDETKFAMFGTQSVEEVVWNYALATSSQHRNIGLAQELMIRSVQLMRKKYLDLAMGYFTNPTSQRIADKVGYCEMARSYFKDAVDEDVDGSKFFAEENGKEKYVSLMILKL